MSDWYTVCGTPVINRAEYVTVVTSFVLLCMYVYVQLLAFSGLQPSAQLAARKKRQ